MALYHCGTDSGSGMFRNGGLGTDDLPGERDGTGRAAHVRDRFHQQGGDRGSSHETGG